MTRSKLEAPPTPVSAARVPTLFNPMRESGPVELRLYTTSSPDGWCDDIKLRAFEVKLTFARKGTDTRTYSHLDAQSRLATMLCEACEEHGPTSDEEAVEVLAATPLRNTVALVGDARRLLVKRPFAPFARVDWILAARVALAAEFFRLQHVLQYGAEPDDLGECERRGAAVWTAYARASRT